MSTGFGGSGWGIGPWGDGAEASSTSSLDVEILDLVATSDNVSYQTQLRVAYATSAGPFYVRVTFSNRLNESFPLLSDPSNYDIPGLIIDSAFILNERQVLLRTTTEQLDTTYAVTVSAADSYNGDTLGADNTADFAGFPLAPSFFAGVQSSTKVALVFSADMMVDSAFLDPSNYTVTAISGGHHIPVVSVAASGPSPTRRATLGLGEALKSKEYYAVIVSSVVLSSTGSSILPDTHIVQWGDMRPPPGASLDIPIRDFSGEVTSGLLGAPDGLVFFSPALEESVTSDSTIELEELSVCTRAYDEYHFPNPPDPIPLFTFRVGGPGGLIGPTNVLWGPAYRLGQAKMNLGMTYADDVLPPIYDFDSATYESPISDTPALGVLREPIDITRAAFLNDDRWKTFPGTTMFITADNLTPVGPGPTVNVTLSNRPRLDVRGLFDDLPVADSVIGEIVLPSGFDVLLTDSLAATDSVTTATSYVFVVGNDAIVVTDSLDIDGVPIDVQRADAVVVADYASTETSYDVALSDAIALTDGAAAEETSGILVEDDISATDDLLVELDLEAILADADDITDEAVADVIGETVLDDVADITDDVFVEVFSIEVIIDTDTVAVTDTVFTQAVYELHPTDTLDVTDDVVADTFGLNVLLVDTMAITDDVAAGKAFEVSLSDSDSVTDSTQIDQL